MEHCSWHFYSSSLFQTCFIVFVTVSSLQNTQNKSFLTQSIYLSLLHTLFQLLSIYFFSFNVNIYIWRAKKIQKISNGVGGLAASTLGANDGFGQSANGIGDIDGDGIPDIAVGAPGGDERMGK